MYAEVIVPLFLPKNYTWSIPDDLLATAQVGCRVEVELRKKKYTGIIASITSKAPEEYQTKDILSVLDDARIISDNELKLWQWIAQYYCCGQGDVMSAALPSYLKLNSESILIFNEEYGDNFTDLGNDEYLVAEALHIKKELKLSEVQQILDSKKVYATIKQLTLKKLCFVWESLKDKYTPKKENYVLLNPQYEDEAKLEELVNNWSKAPKQMELLLAYLHFSKQEGEVTKSNLLKKANATDAQLKGLVEKQILIVEQRNVSRLPSLPLQINIDFTLNEAQAAALQKIRATFAEKKPCLLHGVTSSGKTQVYLKLIEDCIRSGKQCLFLVPEIALTAQLIKKLQKHFGGYLGVYHSKYNDNERIEIWNKIHSGELKIILGTRSALLLPYKNLQLIIVDEEHEPSYKQQEPSPRYHARDTAIYLAHISGANILLGSATPSIESYYNALEKKYGLATLTERYGDAAMPLIHLVDMRIYNSMKKQKTIISTELQNAIAVCIDNERQVILFKNRRGYSPYRVCSTCGWIPKCKHCNVALTHHKRKNHLICHYCNTAYAMMNSCVACGNTRFENKNFGTERLEETVEELFAKATVGRMDIDTMQSKNAHSTLIQQFEQGKINILIGTQMIVKGLDFENVTLVGIVDADSMLNFADFRVNERAFQLMEQVSGRAGRKKEIGNVLIQTMQPAHPIFEFIKSHDYVQFYNWEIQQRKEFFYPPFSRIIKVYFKHPNEQVVLNGATHFLETMPQHIRNQCIGPAEPPINRVRNQYLREIMIKMPKDANFMAQCKQTLQYQTAILQNIKEYARIVVIIDVDAI